MPPPRTSSRDGVPEERYATEGDEVLIRVPGGSWRALLVVAADPFRLNELILRKQVVVDSCCHRRSSRQNFHCQYGENPEEDRERAYRQILQACKVSCYTFNKITLMNRRSPNPESKDIVLVLLLNSYNSTRSLTFLNRRDAVSISVLHLVDGCK